MIRLFYDNIEYRLKGSRKVLNLIEKVIGKEKRTLGDLNFIITDDKKLLEINKEFLNHNYYTDVIAFGFNKEKAIFGEIYLSIDTIKRNANNYKVSLRNELVRVMIHGTLHLCGYKDRVNRERSEMTKKEDYWLSNIEM